MPLYTFYNEKEDIYKHIYMGMNESHEYIDDTGYKWQRVWYAPQAADNTKINPFSEKDFLDKTRQKRGTVGDLWDYSKEFSQRREQQAGVDTRKEKYIKEWERLRKRRYPDRRKKEAVEKLDKIGVIVE